MTTRQRRMKGEGSITRLPSGKYRVRIEVSPSPLGKRRWLTAVVDTQKEATSKLQEFQNEKNFAVLVEKLKDTFKDYIDTYLNYKRSEGLLESTLYRLRQHLEHMSEDSFQDIPVQKITTEFVQTVIDKWKDVDGNKDSSIRIKFKVLQGYFEFLRKRKVISRNPCIEVVFRKTKKPKHMKIRTISQEDHRKLKEAMQVRWDPAGNLREQFLAVYLLAYETGMREGEIAGLKVHSVNLQESSVTVESSLSNVNGKLIDNPPKTAAGYREIVISKNTMGYLQELLTEDKDDYVFRQRKTKLPFKPSVLFLRFKEYQKEAGVDHTITFHEIRHTNASIMIANGVPTPIVTERLGHSSVGVTYNTYAHALRDSEERKKPLVEA